MKAHLAKLSLALLSTVFLLGCQEQGSEPVGPGAEFHHRDGHTKGGDDGETEAATYTVTHFGDITTFSSILTGVPSVGKPGTGVDFGSKAGIVLSDAFVARVPNMKRNKCFPEGMAFRFLADLRLRKNRGVTGHYFFWAFGTDGLTPVMYNILLTGTPSGATFAPDPDKTTIVTWEGDALLAAQGESEESACAPGGAGDRSTVPLASPSYVTIEGDPVVP